jgi:hypothetical protein
VKNSNDKEYIDHLARKNKELRDEIEFLYAQIEELRIKLTVREELNDIVLDDLLNGIYKRHLN